jgi:hypothetical protein
MYPWHRASRTWELLHLIFLQRPRSDLSCSYMTALWISTTTFVIDASACYFSLRVTKFNRITMLWQASTHISCGPVKSSSWSWGGIWSQLSTFEHPTKVLHLRQFFGILQVSQLSSSCTYSIIYSFLAVTSQTTRFPTQIGTRYWFVKVVISIVFVRQLIQYGCPRFVRLRL